MIVYISIAINFTQEGDNEEDEGFDENELDDADDTEDVDKAQTDDQEDDDNENLENDVDEVSKWFFCCSLECYKIPTK